MRYVAAAVPQAERSATHAPGCPRQTDLVPQGIPIRGGRAFVGLRGRATRDPRVVKLTGEAWRHSKAIGAIAPGESASLTDVDITGDEEGVVVGTAKEVATRMLELLAEHRAWGRFATSAEV